MPESKIVRFKVLEIKGAMDYNTASVTLAPEDLVVDLLVDCIEDDNSFVLASDQLNNLVKNVRLIAHVNTSDLFSEEEY